MIRKLIIAIVLPFFTIASNADSVNTKKVSIGLSFSPDFCYRILRSDPSYKFFVDQNNNGAYPSFGFNTGVNCLIQLNKKLNIELGCLYAVKSEKYQFKIDISTTNTVQATIPNQIISKYNYRYIDLPIKFNYTLLDKRIKLYALCGFSSNIYLYQTNISISKYDNGVITRNTSDHYYSEFYAVNFSGLIGLGLDYHINKKLHTRIEPMYRQFITPIANTPVKNYLYTIGVNVAAYYNF